MGQDGFNYNLLVSKYFSNVYKLHYKQTRYWVKAKLKFSIDNLVV